MSNAVVPVRLSGKEPIFGYPVSSLRTEARKGRLALIRVAGKDYVTHDAIKDMERLCREQRASGFGSKKEKVEKPSMSSVTDRGRLAQVAALALSEKLRKGLPTISRKPSGQTPQNVISLGSRVERS